MDKHNPSELALQGQPSMNAKAILANLRADCLAFARKKP
jgi:hypothetical protein